MNNSQLIADLVSPLFSAEMRRLESLLTDLNSRNKQLTSTTLNGIVYGGSLYLPKGCALPRLNRPTLHPSLFEEVAEWVKDRKAITDDMSLVRQTLLKLLEPCQSEREIRSALPECLVSMSPALLRYPRIADAGYTLQSDERAFKQFQKFLIKMEIYSVTKLLY